TVPGPINLKSIADETTIPLESLLKFNPHLKSGVTPQDASTYKIWIPKSYERSFRERSANLAEHRVAVKAEAPRLADVDSKLRKFHRVKRGENLNVIASKYGLSIDELKELNNLRSSTVFRGQKLKVMSEGTQKAVAKATAKPEVKVAAKDDGIYRVRRGDQLHGIAKKFGMSVAELKKINKLQRNGVKVGQILRVSKAG
ncbi:MAG: LysM peptidoglycan-binding domain-containing protein, partial [Bdellovibrionota bacterium]